MYRVLRVSQGRAAWEEQGKWRLQLTLAGDPAKTRKKSRYVPCEISRRSRNAFARRVSTKAGANRSARAGNAGPGLSANA